MKGIILAGGFGTRLYPMTRIVSKHLLPVYDKPMIYYPLSTLMLADIKDILIISTPKDIANYKALLGDGRKWGIRLSYTIQENPDGLANAFLIGKNFIDEDVCAMILGDNIFYGAGLKNQMIEAIENAKKGQATIFGYQVKDPHRFGVVEFDKQRNVISVEEKPCNPKTSYCITGLYFYDNSVLEKVKEVKISQRGELEITDINRMYLKEGNLKLQILDSNLIWMDSGTIESLMDASSLVQKIQNEQGVVISAPEIVAYNAGWITENQLLNLADFYGKSTYGNYLRKMAEHR